jgi:hypothetical protein
MEELEAKGLLWASGPFVQPGVLVRDGLTIFRTDSVEEARKLIEDELLTKLNLRMCEVHILGIARRQDHCRPEGLEECIRHAMTWPSARTPVGRP